MVQSIEKQRNIPYVRDAHEAHFPLRGKMFGPEALKADNVRITTVVEYSKVFPAFETATRGVGESIPHLLQLNSASKYSDGRQVKYTSVYIEEEGGKVYHLEKIPAEHIWT